jgi:fluoride exporter
MRLLVLLCMSMLKLILIIGTGSFIGGVTRFLASRFIQNTVVSAFPWGTFAVNILGCFIIGIIFGISEKGNFLSSEWRLFLTVGFCGGFTTFSTFTQENVALLRDGNFLFFTLYTGLSVFLGLAATFLGNFTIKIL